MAKITFRAREVDIPQLNYPLLVRRIGEVVKAHGFEAGRLSYLFCDDETILATNREFLQHDYYTDIITFDYSTPRRVSGDMVISLDTVATNAAGLGADYPRELLRVIIPGVLHLCGINDKGPGEREIMESHEDAALRLLDNIRRER